MITVLVWWLVITLLGLAAVPLAFWLFARLPGRGLGFTRPLGLLLVSYILWIGATLRIVPNNLPGIVAAVLLAAALSAWLALRRGGSIRPILAHLRAQAAPLLAAELIFALAFLGWAVLRAYTADKIMPAGGEKFMEIAFLNSILRSPSFPPPDPWLSGHSISYYYFGYVMMGVLSTLTRTPAAITFDLYDALLFALTCQAAFALAVEMTALSLFRRGGQILAGLCAAFFTAGMGNLEGLLEALNVRGWLPPGFTAWLALPGFPQNPPANPSFTPDGAWWWWRASRVLQDLDLTNKPIAASPISEFPFFSFLLGDNHAHVLALPFVLLATALALEWMLSPGRLGRLRLAMTALLLGSLVFLNAWDYPIYFALALAAFLAGEYHRAGALRRDHIREAAQRGLWLAGGAVLFFLPWLLSFKSQAGGILPYIFPPTRLPQFTLIFGPFLLILALFLGVSLFQQGGAIARLSSVRRITQWWLRLIAALFILSVLTTAALGAFLILDPLSGGQTLQALQPVLGGGSIAQILWGSLSARFRDPWLILLLSLLIAQAAATLRSAPKAQLDDQRADPARVFAALLALLALLLTLSVEFFYLRDGFGVRMNTVFKFYFQAWLLLACVCGYALAYLLRVSRAAAKFAIAVFAALVILTGLVYPVLSIPSRTAGFSSSPVLDAAAVLRRENPADWAGIDWLQKQVPRGQPAVLLEAPCASYCYGGRISAFTGIPAVLGWSAHEAQWRGGYSEQAGREQDIAAIYTSAEDSQTLDLLHKYQVGYVVLGDYERGYIHGLCSAQDCSFEQTALKFVRILTPAFRQDGLTIYTVPVK